MMPRTAGLVRSGADRSSMLIATSAGIRAFPHAAPGARRAWPGVTGQLPYNALRGAPVSSAASLAAVDGGRCSLSLA